MTNKEKSWKGGQVLTYGMDFITYIIDVITNVTQHTAMYTYENLFSIVYHLMFLVAYVLCFYFLQFKNTEIPCIVLITLLHCIFLFMVLIVKIKLPLIEKGNIWSFGSFSMYIISFGWIFILVALSFLLKVYYDLYYKFIPNGVDIDFGSTEPLRGQFMKYLVYTSMFMWLFYTLEYLKTNNVLLLNFLFILLAVALLVYAIYSFIQRWFFWGTLMTIVSFISMTVVKKINDARINYEFFFTRNQMANNAVLLFGIIFNIMAVYVYYLSSQMVEYTKSIDIPDILKMNPVYHEGFVMHEMLNGMECTFDSNDQALYNIFKYSETSYADSVHIINNKYCKPTSSSSSSTTPAPHVMDIQEKVLDMWDKRGGMNDGSRPNSFMELVASTAKYVPLAERPTPTPTITATPTATPTAIPITTKPV